MAEPIGYDKEKAITTFLYSNIKEYEKYGKKSKNWADIHMFCNKNYKLTIDAVTKEIYSKYRNILDKKVHPFKRILDMPITYLLKLNLYYTRKLLQKKKANK